MDYWCYMYKNSLESIITSLKYNFERICDDIGITFWWLICKVPDWIPGHIWILYSTITKSVFILAHSAVLRHKAGQEGRGEILLENSFMRWRCYQGKIMHTTSKNFSVLYVLRKHQQHINIQWHHLRCYFWLIDHPILEQVATPRSFQLEPILDCPVLDVRQLVRNKRRKEYD